MEISRSRRGPAAAALAAVLGAVALGACGGDGGGSGAGQTPAAPTAPAAAVDPNSDNVITGPINQARDAAAAQEAHDKALEQATEGSP